MNASPSCWACDAKLPEGSKFCPNCGAQLFCLTGSDNPLSSVDDPALSADAQSSAVDESLDVAALKRDSSLLFALLQAAVFFSLAAAVAWGIGRRPAHPAADAAQAKRLEEEKNKSASAPATPVVPRGYKALQVDKVVCGHVWDFERFNEFSNAGLTTYAALQKADCAIINKGTPYVVLRLDNLSRYSHVYDTSFLINGRTVDGVMHLDTTGEFDTYTAD